jgi:predicted PurR-regulated permease PerM
MADVRITVRRDLAVWIAILAGVTTILWLLGGILLPFLLGMAIAYVVDPVVGWLVRRGLSRGVAAGVLVGTAGNFAPARFTQAA